MSYSGRFKWELIRKYSFSLKYYNTNVSSQRDSTVWWGKGSKFSQDLDLSSNFALCQLGDLG